MRSIVIITRRCELLEASAVVLDGKLLGHTTPTAISPDRWDEIYGMLIAAGCDLIVATDENTGLYIRGLRRWCENHGVSLIDTLTYVRDESELDGPFVFQQGGLR